MAIVIDATVAGATANSYQTLAEADAYFEASVNHAEWEYYTDADDRTRALLQATREIDSLMYEGVKYTLEQSLKFPREDNNGKIYGWDYANDVVIIPIAIQRGCNECALWLLKHDANDTVAQTANRGIKSVSMGGTSFSGMSKNAAGTVGPEAAKHIDPYLKRSSSTYKRGTIRRSNQI